ncbi:molecular chaperone [Shewanella oncorhynchi]|uniref:Molecular chaperone n=1 Tax=Shewanella oncorhynchi TaxID=2726434 RepID=A0AA50KAP4_9GAMM|nr:molecular chaperone [Shewanella oncorhynchi]WMB71231.1 molecular chaperone [Shewanella oncorhynchi]
MNRLFQFYTMVVVLFFFPIIALADGFGINATRLIYPQGTNSISTTVRNTQSNLPYLVQVSISKAQDSYIATPFSVTPPLFRLEPKSINQIRIAGNDASLPKDRESIFYFHATAIPATDKPASEPQVDDVHAAVQFGVGSVIKMFYRPTGLSSTSSAAQKHLQFSRHSDGLLVTNPSPFFVSLASIQFGGQSLKLDTPEALTIAPFSSHTYSAEMKSGSLEVEWQTINDQGGINVFKQLLP